jgi:hypothetical protein
VVKILLANGLTKKVNAVRTHVVFTKIQICVNKMVNATGTPKIVKEMLARLTRQI